MNVTICQHIKPSGKRCGSPAVKDREFCYYHIRQEESLPALRDMYIGYNPKAAPGEYPVMGFPTPALEDAAAIQIGFMQVLHGVASNKLDVAKAGRMLSALHGASANLHRLESCFAQTLRELPRQPVAVKRAKKLPRASQKRAATAHPAGRKPVARAAAERLVESAG